MAGRFPECARQSILATHGDGSRPDTAGNRNRDLVRTAGLRGPALSPPLAGPARLWVADRRHRPHRLPLRPHLPVARRLADLRLSGPRVVPVLVFVFTSLPG